MVVSVCPMQYLRHTGRSVFGIQIAWVLCVFPGDPRGVFPGLGMQGHGGSADHVARAAMLRVATLGRARSPHSSGG